MRHVFLDTRFTPKLQNKLKLLLILLVPASFIPIIFFRSSFNTHRPKTLLIFNNENLCSFNRSSSAGEESTQITIVFIVPSGRNNFMQRNLIRQTYGSIRNVNNVQILAVVFMVGGGVDTTADAGKLEAEWVEFGDIIVGDFSDTYRNLSRKSIMAYDWLTTFCNQVDLVVKTDDDVVVNVFKLTEELGKWTPLMLKSFNFWCNVHSTEVIIRDKESIYYVSYDEYAKEKFPKHCAGVGYVTTMAVIRRIASEVSKSFLGSICSHEDVFMTGIVPEKINSVDRQNGIEYIKKKKQWIYYVDKNNPYKYGKYLWHVVDQPINETVDIDKFRRRSGTRIFYLLQHDAHFERKFLRLWHLVKCSFLSENTTNQRNDKLG